MCGQEPFGVPTPDFWSATLLNDYGKCPFRYWVSHVLACNPIEEPEIGLPRRILGETYHKALELYYRKMVRDNLRLGVSDPALCRQLFESAMQDSLDWVEKKPGVRLGEFWFYEKQEIIFRLNRFFQKEIERASVDENGFSPSILEAAFGIAGKESSPPLSIRHNGGEILVRGCIDRVDTAQHADGKESIKVRIIDYKTGSGAITKDDALQAEAESEAASAPAKHARKKTAKSAKKKVAKKAIARKSGGRIPTARKSTAKPSANKKKASRSTSVKKG